jgi:hypothetical protein
VNGDDTEGQSVTGDDAEAALERDRIEQPALIALGRLPDAIHLSRRVKVGRRQLPSRPGPYRDEHHGTRLARKIERHEAVVFVLGVDVPAADAMRLAPLAVRLLVADPDIRTPEPTRAVAHEV